MPSLWNGCLPCAATFDGRREVRRGRTLPAGWRRRSLGRAAACCPLLLLLLLLLGQAPQGGCAGRPPWSSGGGGGSWPRRPPGSCPRGPQLHGGRPWRLGTAGVLVRPDQYLRAALWTVAHALQHVCGNVCFPRHDRNAGPRGWQLLVWCMVRAVLYTIACLVCNHLNACLYVDSSSHMLLSVWSAGMSLTLQVEGRTSRKPSAIAQWSSPTAALQCEPMLSNMRIICSGV